MLVRPGLLFGKGRPGPALDLAYARRGSLDSRETFTRASTAWESDGTSYATNVARFPSGLGLRIEEQRTQYLANPATPATQTQSQAAGTYVLFVKGTGSCALSGGPTGTATEGSPVTFTLASTTSVTFTKSGSLTWFNCQNGSFPTSPILAAAAGTTRSADSDTFALSSVGIPASPTGLTIIGKARTASGIVTGGSSQYIVELSDGTTSNRLLFYSSASNGQISVLDNVGGSPLYNPSLGTNVNDTDIQFWWAIQPGDSAAQVIGGTKNVGAPTSLPAGLTTMRIGNSSAGGSQWNSTIAELQIFNRRLSDADAAARAAAL